MDESALLGERLVDALTASGIPVTSIQQFCETLEAGIAAIHHTTTERLSTTHTPIDWEEVFGKDSAPAKGLSRRCITTLGVLQMLSEKDVLRVEHIGRTRREKVKTFLYLRGLRLREPGESFTERAEQIYGSVDQVPLAILMLRLLYEPWKYAMADRLNLATIGDVRRYATATDLAMHGWGGGEESTLETLYHDAMPETLAKR